METMVVDLLNKNFWEAKKVLVTGNTGFKGSWLTECLNIMGSDVCGYSLQVDEKNILYKALKHQSSIRQVFADLNNFEELNKQIKLFQPDIIFHMAAQPLVKKSYINPLETLNTNIIGTANILEAIKNVQSVKVVVTITSDKCYENLEKDIAYIESDPMGGHDPYSVSKGCAELIVSSYRRSFFNNDDVPSISSVRAGNVIGGGDWSDDRLIPDTIKAFINNEQVSIRYPNAIRPWQDVLDPIFGYLKLAEKQWDNGKEFAQAWNFGPNEQSEIPVKEVVEALCNNWGNGVSWRTDNEEHPHEAGILKLNSMKAKSLLNWGPQKDIHTTINDLVLWYRSWIENEDIRKICNNQIQHYIK